MVQPVNPPAVIARPTSAINLQQEVITAHARTQMAGAINAVIHQENMDYNFKYFEKWILNRSK